MIKTLFLTVLIVLTLTISSCSIEIDQPVQLTPTALADAVPAPSPTSLFPSIHLPVTWADLNLTGKLVYLSSAMEGDQLTSSLQMLDLATGEVATIFKPSGAWIYYAAVSPDAKMLAISYAPPKESDVSSGRSLFIMPLDASSGPRPLVPQKTPDDHYTQAEWSPDGECIYSVHYNSQRPNGGQLDPIYDILRMRYPDGQPEQIADHAFWARLSSDSSRLVYIYVDPESGRNELVIANADGSNSQPVALSGAQPPEVIDAPIFSPDGQSILFSAPEPSQSYQPNFFERVMGIQVAKAHNVPSDWWSVPVGGGVPTRLTHLQTVNLFASISPDQSHIASLSREGIFVMDLDGSNLTQLVSDPGVHGTVNWIP